MFGATTPSTATRSDGGTASMTLVEPDARRGSRPAVAGQVARVGAHWRLERELRSIAVDLLGAGDGNEFSAACAEWVATTTDAAVSRVTASALEALVGGLDSLLVDAPSEVLRQLDRARARCEAGID
jgi:hypothetical protein